MPNPFPGMNPYLERAEYWSDFHNQLVAAIARSLVPSLVPKYRVVTDKWVYRTGDFNSVTAVAANAPSVRPIKVGVPLREEVRQSYIEVKDAATKEVVTVIELLSPANKVGEGRQKYLGKRQQILESVTHLVEIDLLRRGSSMPVYNNRISNFYRIVVSRGDTRPTADLYAFNVGDRIPSFPLPLLAPDAEPIVDLQLLVSQLYDQLAYDYFINYNTSPPSPWSFDDAKSWVGDDR